MNDMVEMRHGIPALAMDETELIKVLESSLYPGAQIETIKMVVGYCRAGQLDPLQKPVHIVPMSVKKAGTRDYEWRDVIMPGIGLYRTQAARSREMAGVDEPVFGPPVEISFKDKSTVRVPEWCKVTVYRMVDGVKCAYTAQEFWIENYATAGRDTDLPNAMWKKRPRGQLAKCAEAQALRKAFPEQTGAAPTAEEMAGKTIDEDTIDGDATGAIKPAVEMPRSKSAAKGTTPAPAADPQKSEQKPAPSGDSPLATDGEKKFIEKKLETLGISLEDALKECGIADFEKLTADGFIAMRDYITSNAK